MALPKAAALALVALALCGSATAGRSLKQTSATVGSEATITGTAIIIASDLPARKADRMLALRLDSGRYMHIGNVDPATIEEISTGQTISVTGEIVEVVDSLNDTAAGATAVVYDSPGKSGKIKTIKPAKIAKLNGPNRRGREHVQVVPAEELGSVTEQRFQSRRRLQGVQMAPVSPIYLSYFAVQESEAKALVVPIAAVNPATGAACPGTALPTTSRDAVRNAMFFDPDSVSKYYSKCSLQKTLLREPYSAVANRVNLPCSGTSYGVPWTFSKCDFDDFNGYADAAEAVLVARGVNLDAYKYKVFLIPPSACGFVGLGYVGCDGSFPCRVWIGADFWKTSQAIAHELGHNMYLGHAGSWVLGTFDEYADDTCAMGYCCADRCPNAPHNWQLGWSQLVMLNGTNLPAGATVNLTVPSPSLHYRAGIRIVPTWAPTVQPFFLSYRIKAQFDAWLPDSLANKVHIHQSTISSSTDSDLTTWRTGISVGNSYSHPGSGIVVRRMSSTLGGQAVVTVCRRAGPETKASCLANTDNNCDGRAGDDDPQCANYL